MDIPKIIVIGENTQGGTYILRILLQRDIDLQFGRFKKGKMIHLPAGVYTYVGSALSEKGATSLARRLVRHATRTGDKPAHRIREQMLNRFQEIELGPLNPLPKNGKKLFWNIDHLLDLDIVEIINVIVLRSTERLESTIVEYLENDPETQVIEKSLGANDSPKNTHILHINADEQWWLTLSNNLKNKYFEVKIG